MITVIDYGMGNLRSVVKAVELYTPQVQVSADPNSIKDSKGIILPGDGAFAMAMENLTVGGWVEPLREYINSGGCFLGICLGYQLLFTESEEFGASKGLNVIPGKIVRFSDHGLKIPHMGWNNVAFKGDTQYLKGIPDGSYFYFIHSYHPVVDDESWILGETEYGDTFPCIVGKENCIATQFHPEKSHTEGLKIIENFVRIAC